MEPTAVQLLPQPARKLGLPPGRLPATTEGFDKTLNLSSYAVGAAALYDLLPADLDLYTEPCETSELAASATRMVAVIQYTAVRRGHGARVHSSRTYSVSVVRLLRTYNPASFRPHFTDRWPR